MEANTPFLSTLAGIVALIFFSLLARLLSRVSRISLPAILMLIGLFIANVAVFMPQGIEVFLQADFAQHVIMLVLLPILIVDVCFVIPKVVHCDTINSRP